MTASATPSCGARSWEIWDLKDESSVRRRIKALRKAIAPAVVEAEAEIIENLPWKGYRLKPELVTVRRVSLAEALKPPPGKPAPIPAAATGPNVPRF